eukprot:2228111-Rhodomonas_salina.2
MEHASPHHAFHESFHTAWYPHTKHQYRTPIPQLSQYHTSYTTARSAPEHHIPVPDHSVPRNAWYRTRRSKRVGQYQSGVGKAPKVVAEHSSEVPGHRVLWYRHTHSISTAHRVPTCA